VQQADTWRAGDGTGNPVDNVESTPLADVRHALHPVGNHQRTRAGTLVVPNRRSTTGWIASQEGIRTSAPDGKMVGVTIPSSTIRRRGGPPLAAMYTRVEMSRTERSVAAPGHARRSVSATRTATAGSGTRPRNAAATCC